MTADAAIPPWLVEENARRTPAYRRDPDDEIFLRRLNEHLAPHEEAIDAPAAPPHPLLFIVGLPRAGKTLFSQTLSFCLDVGYIDNVAARFWRAPTFGIRLSQAIGARTRDVDFSSDYGKTGGPSGPHDFSYFWHDWLRIDAMPYDPAAARDRIDWDGLRRALARISAAFGRAGVFKSPNPAYHAAAIADLCPGAVFLELRRDPIDVACSLCRGRRDNFGTPDAWYGQWPDRSEHLLDLPYAEQIGGQLAALDVMFERELDAIEPSRVMRLTYDELCADPRATLGRVVERVRDRFGFDVHFTSEPPTSFPLSRHDPSGDEFDRLADGLRKFGVPLRLSDETPHGGGG